MDETNDEISLTEALQQQQLPKCIQVSRDVKLHNETVLAKDQRLTVLDRKDVDLLYGKDWGSNIFRLNINVVKECWVNPVDEFYPNTVADVRYIAKGTDYIEAKTTFKDLHDFQFNKYDRLKFWKFLDENQKNIVFTDINNQTPICIDVSELLNGDRFVFVTSKPKVQIKDLLSQFTPQTVSFRDDDQGIVLPRGNVKLEGSKTLDTIFTVTRNGYELLYETFPADRRIKVYRTFRKIPNYVKALGEYFTSEYQNSLKEVNFLMFYQIDSPRFYGSLKVENHLYEQGVSSDEDEKNIQQLQHFQRPSHLDLASKKNKFGGKIRSSIRKLIGHSPTKEESRYSFEPTDAMDVKKKGVYTPFAEEEEENDGNDKKIEKNDFQRCSSPDFNNDSMLSSDYDPHEKSGENAIYGMDTIKINQLRNHFSTLKIVSKNLKAGEMKRRKDTEPQLLQTFSGNNSDLFFEPKTNERSIGGGEAIFYRKNRSPSDSEVSKPEIDRLSRSISPDALTRFTHNEAGVDSGIDDSPDIKKGKQQLLQAFEKRIQEELQRKTKFNLSDISLPLNVVHTDGCRDCKQHLYEIPKRFTASNNTDNPPINLDGSANFSRNDSIQRSNSEPLLIQKKRPKEIPVYAEVSYDKVKERDLSNADTQLRQELYSLREFKQYSIEQVSDVLKELNLEKHVTFFKKELVNGSFLINTSESTLRESCHLTKFEACKLFKYVHGWRPKTVVKRSSVISIEDLPHSQWSVSDVVNELNQIRLPQFAEFCFQNQVDGTLLWDLNIRQILTSESLENDGVILSKIESERLRQFISGNLRFGDDDKKFIAENML